MVFLVLLAAALVLSLVVGLGLAAAQGREWQVAPTWLADEQTQRIAIDPTDVGTAYGGHPAQSTLKSEPLNSGCRPWGDGCGWQPLPLVA